MRARVIWLRAARLRVSGREAVVSAQSRLWDPCVTGLMGSHGSICACSSLTICLHLQQTACQAQLSQSTACRLGVSCQSMCILPQTRSLQIAGAVRCCWEKNCSKLVST